MGYLLTTMMIKNNKNLNKEKDMDKTKATTWMCKPCSRVNSIKFDKCYSCGKPRNEVQRVGLEMFSGDAVEDEISRLEQELIDITGK